MTFRAEATRLARRGCALRVRRICRWVPGFPQNQGMFLYGYTVLPDAIELGSH